MLSSMSFRRSQADVHFVEKRAAFDNRAEFTGPQHKSLLPGRPGAI